VAVDAAVRAHSGELLDREPARQRWGEVKARGGEVKIKKSEGNRGLAGFIAGTGVMRKTSFGGEPKMWRGKEASTLITEGAGVARRGTGSSARRRAVVAGGGAAALEHYHMRRCDHHVA
jgi:hypothetical protein